MRGVGMMAGGMSARGRAVCDEFWARVGGGADGMAAEWRSMSIGERAFWLRVSKLPVGFAQQGEWRALSGHVRCTVKNNLWRAANRAAVILGAAGAASASAAAGVAGADPGGGGG